jgi:hypothetical protein
MEVTASANLRSICRVAHLRCMGVVTPGRGSASTIDKPSLWRDRRSVDESRNRAYNGSAACATRPLRLVGLHTAVHSLDSQTLVGAIQTTWTALRFPSWIREDHPRRDPHTVATERHTVATKTVTTALG